MMGKLVRTAAHLAAATAGGLAGLLMIAAVFASVALGMLYILLRLVIGLPLMIWDAALGRGKR